MSWLERPRGKKLRPPGWSRTQAPGPCYSPNIHGTVSVPGSRDPGATGETGAPVEEGEASL